MINKEGGLERAQVSFLVVCNDGNIIAKMEVEMK